MTLLTTRKERLIRMEEPREVSKREKMIFSVVAFLLCCFLAPAALPLLGMLCFGNVLKEAGVSAVPDSARVVQVVGQREDSTNFLLMHAMAPNVSGVIGSAIAAGVLWSLMA